MTSRFSSRHGFATEVEAPIVVRHDAPEEFRGVLLMIAHEVGFRPMQLRQIVCSVLRKVPDKTNWSEYPNVDREVTELVRDCEWYQVYDIVEALAAALRSGARISSDARGTMEAAERFDHELNRYFRASGIGWQVVEGLVEVRGTESFEKVMQGAVEALDEARRPTAARELHEALRDLSRRPEPDVTGAIQHALAALECVARDAAGDPKATLGALLKKNPDLVPRPLDEVLDKVWGYASEVGRHLREGREPDFDEAELLVGFAGAACRYLAHKLAC